MLQMKRPLITFTLICFLLTLTTCGPPVSPEPEEPPAILPTTPSPAPAVGGLIEKGDLAAANSEVVIVKVAANTFQAVTGTWPRNSNHLMRAGYLDRKPEETYKFDTTSGEISGVTSSGKWISAGFVFNVKTQKWE